MTAVYLLIPVAGWIAGALVERLVVEGGRVVGVEDQTGFGYQARAVILATGTFLGGLVHIGYQAIKAGRAGEFSAEGLAAQLRALGFQVGRMKTGTPPRIDKRSVDFSVLEEQPGDDPRPVFSYMGSREDHPRQLSCWITHTGPATHELIRAALHRSPMYAGAIEGADELARDTLFYDQSAGGVTLSGGEPLAQPAFCVEVLRDPLRGHAGSPPVADAAGRANRWSRWRGRQRRTRCCRHSRSGGAGTPTPPRPSSQPTCWWTECVVEARCGTAYG